MDGRKERELFSVRKPKPVKKFGKRKKGSENEGKGEQDDSKKQRISNEGGPAYIEPLSYPSLMSGLVTLGRISSITNYDIAVSLPFMVSGRVPITRISQAYTSLLKKVTESKDESSDAEDEVFTLQSLFYKGQYVVTRVESVEKVENIHKVNLCLLPQEVNFGVASTKLREGVVIQCAVASVEDNGYVMETGIPRVKVAFLNKAKAEGAKIVGVGSIVQCLVNQVRTSEDGNSVQVKLSAIPKEVNDAYFDVTETEDLSLLLPGVAIKTTIAKVGKDCLKLIMAETDGVVSSYHLQSPVHQLDKYSISQSVKARVLYITPLSRIVHLTLQNSIFTERSGEDLLHGLSLLDKKQGEVCEVAPKGVYFKIGSCRAFCGRKYLSDKEGVNEDGCRDFPIGSQRMLRIMSYHYFDEIFVVSLQKSMLNDQVVGFSSLEVGQVLKATIKEYDSNKAIVNIAKNVDGEIPFLHLTDTAVKHPEKKYAVGNPINVRVLEVAPERRRLILTCKKLLVNSKEAIVSEYNTDLENTFRRGFIVQIKPSGLLIAFYNGVTGFVPKSQASTEKVGDLNKKFSLGNVVKCKVLSVKPEEKKMILSLILYKENSEKKVINDEVGNTIVTEVEKPKKVLSVRTVANCRVTKVENDTVKVRIKPGNIRGEIPVSHLSDDRGKRKALMGMLSQGDQIYNAAVFKKTNTITLSMKDSVCQWIQTCKPNAQEQLQESATYPAVVSEILPTGIMVSVPVGENGQDIPVHLNLEKNDEATSEGLSNVNHAVGESVQVKCNGFGEDDDDKQPILSIQGTTKTMDKRQQLQSLYNNLKYHRVLQKNLVRKALVSRDFGYIEVGNKLEVDVVAVTSLGLLVKNENYGIYGIVMNEHLEPNAKYEIGIRIPVLVLHVHMKEKCVVLAAKHDLVDLLYLHEFSQIKVEQKARGEVLLVQKDFILVSLKSRCKGLMVYLPPKKNVKIGHNIAVTVKYVEKKLVLCVTKVQNKMRPFPVLPNLSVVDLNVIDDNTQQENVCVDIDEEEALGKIKKILFFSGKKVNEGTDTSGILNSKKGNSMENAGKKYGGMQKEKDEILLSKKPKSKKNAGKNDEMSLSKNTKSKKSAGKNDEMLLSKKNKSKKNSSKEDEDDSGVDENMEVDEIPKISKKSKPCLKLSTGFVWNVPENEGSEDGDDSSGSEEDEEDEAKKKKVKKLSKVERELLAKEEEKRLHELESARLEKERLPQSSLDYEELLQESPNSSAIWIQFISFHLENAEVARARSVAQRALQTIDVQEFEERINVWTVMLRLEVLYGTEESTDAAFSEALATNDPLKMYLAMAMVYAESNKIKEAEDIYFKMTKKFSQTFDVWIKAGIFLFKNNKLEEGRRYMDRALLSLDKTHHVNLINRYAQLEFQFGEVERGRTMFESLLSNYPKRMDMWIVYVDLLAKREDIEGARQVLERMTSLKLRLRQMRSVFKKFLEFEKIHGTAQSVESVKNRVQDYVAASLKQE